MKFPLSITKIGYTGLAIINGLNLGLLLGFFIYILNSNLSLNLNFLNALNWLLSPEYLIWLLAVLCLEFFFPAQHNLNAFPLKGKAILEDLVYSQILKSFLMVFSVLYLNQYLTLVSNYFSIKDIFPSIRLENNATKIIIGFIVTDFFAYLNHFLRHKISYMWKFHMLHHSQQVMNIFSKDRVHPIEYIFAWNIKFLPILWITSSVDITLGFLFFHRFHDVLNHSNVRTNLGFLRYIFVTPQSHRIHHSSHPKHFNKNFGVSLSIWDHIFKTQYLNYQEYPETGWSLPEKESHSNLFYRVVTNIFRPFRAS